MALQGGTLLLALHGTGGASNVEYLFLGNDGYFQNLWRKKWLKQWERETPGIDEVVKFVSRQVAIDAPPTNAAASRLEHSESLAYNAQTVFDNIKILEIAGLILVDINRRNRALEDEDDVDFIFLM